MAQFYKELKELRESREISIEEISDRTKINIQFLNNIESGEFGGIELPYLRLFLRAYAEEIGGDSKRALEQLDSFMGISAKPVQAIPSEVHVDELDSHGNKQNAFSNSNQKLRQDLIKGGILLLVFVFAIFIFQKLFPAERVEPFIEQTVTDKNKAQNISIQNISTNFFLDQKTEQILSVSPPFYVKLRSLDKVVYSFKNDTLPTFSSVLLENKETDIGVFVNTSELMFNHTIGLTVFVNGLNLASISNYNYPLRLTIKPYPPSVVIQRYKPLQ